MYSAKIPKLKTKVNLKSVIENQKNFNQEFENEKLRKLGLTQHLEEVYKPLTETQKTIVKKIEESTKTTRRYRYKT